MTLLTTYVVDLYTLIPNPGPQPGERPDGALRALPEPSARPEAMDEAEIEAQVARHLKEGLEVIPEAELAAALHNYVDKVRPKALSGLGAVDAVGAFLVRRNIQSECEGLAGRGPAGWRCRPRSACNWQQPA